MSSTGTGWRTPKLAHGKCHVASTIFAVYLRQRGVACRFVRAEHRAWGARHYAVEADGLVVD